MNKLTDDKVQAALDRIRSYSPSLGVAGTVYLIHNPCSGLYKIGRTTYLGTRISQIRKSEDCEEACIVHTIETNDYKWLEEHLHALLDSKRDHGEWFDLDDADVEWLKRCPSLNRRIVKARSVWED